MRKIIFIFVIGIVSCGKTVRIPSPHGEANNEQIVDTIDDLSDASFGEVPEGGVPTVLGAPTPSATPLKRAHPLPGDIPSSSTKSPSGDPDPTPRCKIAYTGLDREMDDVIEEIMQSKGLCTNEKKFFRVKKLCLENDRYINTLRSYAESFRLFAYAGITDGHTIVTLRLNPGRGKGGVLQYIPCLDKDTEDSQLLISVPPVNEFKKPLIEGLVRSKRKDCKVVALKQGNFRLHNRGETSLHSIKPLKQVIKRDSPYGFQGCALKYRSDEVALEKAWKHHLEHYTCQRAKSSFERLRIREFYLPDHPFLHHESTSVHAYTKQAAQKKHALGRTDFNDIFSLKFHKRSGVTIRFAPCGPLTRPYEIVKVVGNYRSMGLNSGACGVMTFNPDSPEAKRIRSNAKLSDSIHIKYDRVLSPSTRKIIENKVECSN